MSRFTFEVAGVPFPQGSKKLANGHLIDDNPAKLKAWRDLVATEALLAKTAARWGTRIIDEAIDVELLFRFKRPKSVTRPYPSVKPDLDKLERAVLDAITGVLIVDDALVVDLSSKKRYAPDAGLVVTLRSP